MNNTDIRDLSDAIRDVHYPTEAERAIYRANALRRFRAEDAELLIAYLGVAS